MAVEMGAKTAYMQPNKDVLDYVEKRAVRPYEVQYTDPDFEYEESYTFDVSKMNELNFIFKLWYNVVKIFTHH